MYNYIIFSEYCRKGFFSVTLQSSLLRSSQNIPEHLEYVLSFKTVNGSTLLITITSSIQYADQEITEFFLSSQQFCLLL